MASYLTNPLVIPTKPLTWKKGLLLAAAGLAGFFIVSGLLFAIFQPIQVLPRVRLAPGFSMTDQNGLQLTNESLRGQIVLYNFSYSRCADLCNEMNNTMQNVLRRVDTMNLSGVPFTMVTVSFDPEYDTPEVLKAYADTLGADPVRWHFATLTDPVLLKTIVGEGFEAYYQQQPDGSFEFSPAFVLVDGLGIIRGQYRYETLASDVDRISRHIGILAEEVQKSTGANRLVYEAAHLFLCYAP